jgi:hypothetical protein
MSRLIFVFFFRIHMLYDYLYSHRVYGIIKLENQKINCIYIYVYKLRLFNKKIGFHLTLMFFYIHVYVDSSL